LADSKQLTKSPVRAVIFDCDGTLVDSYPAITASVNHVRATHGLAPLSETEVRRHVGRGPANLLQHTVPGSNIETDLAEYKAHHPSVLKSGSRLLPHVAEELSALHQRGLRLAVCSNKLRLFTLELLDILDIGRYFQAVIGPEDAPRLKPAPDMLLAALARLAVPAAEALYIGDMAVDIETARAAGVAVWVVSTGSDTPATLTAAKPDRVLEDLGNLSALLGPTDRQPLDSGLTNP
jgi:phosphoglycolate phosphatase